MTEDMETVVVRVAEGELRGRKVKSHAGGFYWGFQGIPFAKPPVGPLRFKDPEPPEPWEGVRDATTEGSICTQYNLFTTEYEGSEDCLFLNVYTPHKPAPGVGPLPVMAFIHGGGFECGSANAFLAGPDYLVGEDVILVSFNYRVGVLGFLFLEEASPGNVGLKDQVAALRWVQRNIAAFGGDPGNVTLFGMSAGGASVHFQMLSPMSKGLFHRAIAMSGAALNPWGIQTDPADTTRHLARLLGCTSDDPMEIVEFLRKVDHNDLVRMACTGAVPEKDKVRLAKFRFVTTPERVVPGVETFLPASAEQLMKEGKHHDVPYITGITETEASIVFLWHDVRKEEVQKRIDSNWEGNILSELRLPSDGPKNKEALAALRQFFMRGKPLTDETLPDYMKMASDLTFNEGIFYALRCMAKKSTAPLYQYIFKVTDDLNMVKNLLKIDYPTAGHGDDGGYLFHMAVAPEVAPDSTAATTRRRMLRLYTNFAKTGDPTPEDDPLLGVRWKPYSDKERNFLEIGTKELSTGKDLLADRVAFWENFYATYGS